jgi:hypothetical protein
MIYLKTFESFAGGNRGYVMQVIASMCEGDEIDFSLETTSIKNGKETDSFFVFRLEKGPQVESVHEAIARLDEIGYFAQKVKWIHAFHCVMVYKKDCVLVDYMDEDFASDLSRLRNAANFRSLLTSDYSDLLVGSGTEKSEEIYADMIKNYEHVVLGNETYFIGEKELQFVTLNHGSVEWKDGKFEWTPKTKTKHFATMYKTNGSWWSWYSTLDVKDCVFIPWT